MSGDDLLEWLNVQTDLELSFKHSDDDDPLDGVWCVHQCRGSVNDREWHLIASGPTPYEALRQARALLKEDDQ
jgi:hypothetical protein